MDRLRELLSQLKAQGLAEGHLLGLLHVLIGRRIHRPDGTAIAAGLTWREVASLLKRVRWGPEAVQELGLDPKTLPPRDRERYWYTVITRARVDSAGLRSTFMTLLRRPVPFDTYHTSRDALRTLQPAAMDLTVRALEAVIEEMSSLS